MTLVLVAYVEEHTQEVLGSTVDLILKVRDRDTGALTNLDATPTITIDDSEGTEVVSAAATTAESTGVYSYKYTSGTTDPVGTYKAVFSGADGGNTQKAVARFVIRGD